MRLLTNSIDALLARLALADRAKYSIDLQYYIFHGDATGKLLAQHLVAAADRGVRVRVLLDDLHEVGKEAVLRALDGHPNIEIRVFNPFYERSASMWGMGKQFTSDFWRLNRRMHNKSFTVDGVASVIGGRNIGDEYFDASDAVNFRDLDVLMVGPVVAEVSTCSISTGTASRRSRSMRSSRPRRPTSISPPCARTSTKTRARSGKRRTARGCLSEAGEARGQGGTPSKWDWGPATFLADATRKR